MEISLLLCICLFNRLCPRLWKMFIKSDSTDLRVISSLKSLLNTTNLKCFSTSWLVSEKCIATGEHELKFPNEKSKFFVNLLMSFKCCEILSFTVLPDSPI